MRFPHQSKASNGQFNFKGYKALIITISQSTLDKIDSETGEVLKVGKPTGVYASEMTEPYYVFSDAQMEVYLASIIGGRIPIDKLSMMPLIRTKYDIRLLKDDDFQQKVKKFESIAAIDMSNYDMFFLSGGWGAAYDFAQSEILSKRISEAYASGTVLAAVCHGPLGFIGAQKSDGSALVENLKMTGVTNKQLKELMVGDTPKHLDSELRKGKALYERQRGLLDMFQSKVVVDEDHRIVTGQN